MKIRKLLAAIAAAVTALSAVSFPVSAKTVDQIPSWFEDEVKYLQSRFGPFYTLGTDVSAYEPGDITMDGKVDYLDCTAIQHAYNIVVLLEEPNYLTEEQMQLGNVAALFDQPAFPINPWDASVIQQYLNFRDLLQEDVTLEEVLSRIELRRQERSKK